MLIRVATQSQGQEPQTKENGGGKIGMIRYMNKRTHSFVNKSDCLLSLA